MTTIALRVDITPEITLPAVTGAVPVGVPVETDPTVPAWAKAPTKPTYTAEEVGAVPVDTALTTIEIENMLNTIMKEDY